MVNIASSYAEASNEDVRGFCADSPWGLRKNLNFVHNPGQISNRCSRTRKLYGAKIINHRKFYQTHGENLFQIGIFGGRAISKAISLGRAGWENHDPAARRVVGHPSSRCQ
jgi:hypothetical protein